MLTLFGVGEKSRLDVIKNRISCQSFQCRLELLRNNKHLSCNFVLKLLCHGLRPARSLKRWRPSIIENIGTFTFTVVCMKLFLAHKFNWTDFVFVFSHVNNLTLVSFSYCLPFLHNKTLCVEFSTLITKLRYYHCLFKHSTILFCLSILSMPSWWILISALSVSFETPQKRQLGAKYVIFLTTRPISS